MKPIKILFFLLSVFFSLGFVSYIFPKQGIRITNQLNLTFISLTDLFFAKQVKYADITSLLKKHDLLNKTADTALSVKIYDTVRANADSLKNIVHFFEYPKNNPSALYPFFRHLKKQKGLIRILHYGDSQIEGDRITAPFRNKIQLAFGGSGVGLQPAVEIYNYSSSLQHFSENLIRYSLLDKKDSLFLHNRYGIMGNFGRFKGENKFVENLDTVTEGRIILRNSSVSYKTACRPKQCKLFLGNNPQPLIALFSEEGNPSDSVIIPAQDGLSELTWTLKKPFEEISIRLKGKESPDIYAVALDDTSGIAVDNIPMRGSAGVDFTKMDLSFLQSMYNLLNVQLLILEFGVNVVPYITEDYQYYGNWFYQQLVALKKLKPDLCILVIGVSDMSRKVNDHFESYPNIEKIRNVQRDAAFRAGCAFWDMYSAMGGDNSMPSWVFAKPALAQKDFTHFTERGSQLIGEMLFNAFIFEYKKYIRN